MKTKFNLKLLLLVSILLIAMCIFNINIVQATDVETDETKTVSEELEEKIAKIIPDTISINVTESETLAELEENKELEGYYTYSCKAIDLVATEFNNILESNGITLPIIIQDGSRTEKISYSVGFEGARNYEAQWDMENVDITTIRIYAYSEISSGGSHGSSGGETEMKIKLNYMETDNAKILNSLNDTVTVDIKESEVDLNTSSEHTDTNYENTTLSKIDTIIRKQLTDQGYDASTLTVQFINVGLPINIHEVYVTLGFLGQEQSRIIQVNYSNTLQYNETDETYVKNAVDNINFLNVYDGDSIVQVYNIGDEESASKWNYEDYDFSSLINDSSITVKATYGTGGQGGGTPWGHGVNLYFFKNNVLYLTKHIGFWGMYGITLENGTPVNMAKLEEDNEVYKLMAEELEKNGLTNIIGCYELEAFGTTYKDMIISFNIGSNYNGKEVKILHKKSDNTYETFTTKVENGNATITVDEFSPFMIALSNSTSDRELDDEPKTRYSRLYNICKYYCSNLFKRTSNIKI